MSLDEEILAEARRAKDGLVVAVAEADRARADHAGHVRRLYAAGASLREVGEALGLSHQRVHQIVDADRSKRGSSPHHEQRCSFCHSTQAEVDKIIAGPGCYICSGCVRAASDVASGTRRGADDRPAMTTVPPGVKGGQMCSFCGKIQAQVETMVVGGDTRICDECLDLCQEIVAEEMEERR